MKKNISDRIIGPMVLLSIFSLFFLVVLVQELYDQGGSLRDMRIATVFALIAFVCCIVPVITARRFRRRRRIASDGVDVEALLASYALSGGMNRGRATLQYTYSYEMKTYKKPLRLLDDEAIALREENSHGLTFRIDPRNPNYFVVVHELYQ